MNEKKILINEIEISYQTKGEGDIIILLHGWPQTSYMWRKVIPLLSKKFKVITLDLPGLGKSGDAKSYDTKNIATILNDFRIKLEIDRFHLVGHDIGSWVAASFFIFFKEYLKSLTVIDAGIPGLIPNELFSLENKNKIWQFYFHSIEDMPEFLTAGKEKEYISWYFNKKSYIKDAINEIDIETYYTSYKEPNKMKNGFNYYRYFEESAEQNKTLTSTVSTNILAIGGEYALGSQIGIAMKRLSTNVTTEVIKDCAHYVPEEQPEELVRILINWINEIKCQL
jgi:pimeloyl-ACP methyl ester carboxylesterase